MNIGELAVLLLLAAALLLAFSYAAWQVAKELSEALHTAISPTYRQRRRDEQAERVREAQAEAQKESDRRNAAMAQEMERQRAAFRDAQMRIARKPEVHAADRSSVGGVVRPTRSWGGSATSTWREASVNRPGFRGGSVTWNQPLPGR
ncbi:hypothetical protein [Ornithinicoccus hortensis]|uniref:hypothetical protein n=1 Tax=Ornithinicoccus hortensis TaxID=82346 RepID=UPI00114D5D65|nr:hypothetical protein [Ornithinicoccus hortensis]